jgi:hypothetical protein
MVLRGTILTTLLNTLVNEFLSFLQSAVLTTCLGGLLGPLIIHGPSNAKYDIDLGPVFLTDWYHTEYFPKRR